MMDDQYVFYGMIRIHLDSVMRIGSGREVDFGLADDGEGRLILPSSAIAGCVRSYLEAENVPETEELFGSVESGNSRVIIYDAPAENATIEKRTGIRMNGSTGTAADGGLFQTFFISEGMETVIRMQAFPDSENAFDDIFQKIVNGIDSHEITFGTKGGIGAGQFSVLSAKRNVLNLMKKEDLSAYLKGIDPDDPENAFHLCTQEVSPVKTDLTQEGLFELEVEAPDGILVGGGDPTDTERKPADDIMMHHVVKGRDIPYIPGSSIRGVLRNYAERLADTLGLDSSVVEKVFGNSTKTQRGENAGKQKGMIQCSDVNINVNQDGIYMVRDRIRIDRWLGSVMNHALMNQKVVFTKTNHTFRIQVRVMPGIRGTERKNACAMVFLALRDIGAGLVPVGADSAIGYGYLKGVRLNVEGTQMRFEENENGMRSLHTENQNQISEWLQSLTGGQS